MIRLGANIQHSNIHWLLSDGAQDLSKQSERATTLEEYQAMATIAREVQGKVVISINDHPDIRERSVIFASLVLVQNEGNFRTSLKATTNPKP